MTTVYAFDRDHTVDVNPHPEKAAVPLAWIIELSMREDVEVWAIGNQRLTHEADIPGLAELQRRLGEAGMRARGLGVLTWLDGVVPPRLTDRIVPESIATRLANASMPPRRDRLRLLGRLFPDADAHVVVDDADLGDVEGWEHYFPWEFYRSFYEAFEASTVPSVDTSTPRR